MPKSITSIDLNNAIISIHNYMNPEMRRTAVNQALKRAPLAALIQSPTLLNAIIETNSSLASSSARDKNIEALKTPETIVVITGQQMGLFLGPLLSYYKALNVIHIARTFERETGVRTVPIFWLQTEDHDFEEVNHCYLPLPDGTPLKITLDGDSNNPHTNLEAKTSLAYRLLGADILNSLAILEDKLNHFPHSKQYLEKFKRWYQPNLTYSQAFSGLMSELFKEEGLVFFDPRHPNVPSLCSPIYQSALLNYKEISLTLKCRDKELKSVGKIPQVYIRDNSPLFFFHQESDRGARVRLEWNGNSWSLLGTEKYITEDQLLAIINNCTNRLSSSALLRPIVQDYLFPNAAYIGGPAEQEYFLQISPLYPMFNLEQPLFVPRQSFICLEPKVSHWLNELQIKVEDLMATDIELLTNIFKNSSAVRNSPLDHNSEESPSGEKLLEKLRMNISQGMNAFREHAALIDSQLLGSIDKTHDNIFGLLEKLYNRYLNALSNLDKTNKDRLQRLKTLLFPFGKDQERVYSLPYFLCRYGENFEQALKDANNTSINERVLVKL